MYLPAPVLRCIDLLEAQGYEAWAVGGCVRDDLLGIRPHDFDLCTSASPQRMQQIFAEFPLVLAGVKHGTVGVVTEGQVVEITTFRTEGGYCDSRHPGWVEFVPDVDADLARRDFTVNAMAYSPARGYRDPFGGREDLKNGVLRCVGDPAERFREDALRILRGARFAARFHMTVEPATWEAMLAAAPLIRDLARERVFEELCRLIVLTDGSMLCRLAPILAQAIEELGPMIGFDQRSPHHAHDVFTHTAYVVQRVPPVLPLRLAALLHDVAKPRCFTLDENGRGHFYGHAHCGARMAEEILLRLKAPTWLREEAVWLVEHHMALYQAERKGIRRLLSRYGKERLLNLSDLQRADVLGKDAEPVEEKLAELDAVRQLIGQVEEEEGRMSLKRLAVKGRDLMDLGYAPGVNMGVMLGMLLDAVISEEVPNEKQALFAWIDRRKDRWPWNPDGEN